MGTAPTFTRPPSPEWVRRIEEATALAVAYIENLAWQHAQGEHSESASGAHDYCEACLLTLSGEELVREHRGW